MADSNYIDLLKQLKDQYDKRAVSVLVGSGFSKNAFPNYPDWKELLFDMVVELYGDEIEKEKEFNKEDNTHRDFKGFQKDKVYEFIDSKGYFEIVEQYEQKRGIREAIDVYIEDHIPHIIKKDGIFYWKTAPIDLSLDTHKGFLKCNWKNIFTTNYDNLLELTSDSFGLGYKQIIADYQLSNLGSSRSIIKLHGNLVADTLDTNYEFDNDKGRRYVISKEDYATYADKHKAFTSLIRTSLLTDIFCLIGFSGDDPNFKNWMDWVTDVLNKELVNNKEKTKVFLLTIKDEQIDKAQLLHFQNLRIAPVCLTDPEVLKFLRVKEPASVPIILSHLFDFLEPKPIENNSSAIWDSLSDDKNDPAQEIIASIREKRSLTYVAKNTRNQYNFIYNFVGKKDWTKSKAILFAIAANDCGLIPSAFPKNKIGQLDSIPEWQYLQLLETTYEGKKFTNGIEQNNDLRTYFQILRHLYLLEFSEAKQLLENWHNDKDWVVCKSSLIADIDRDGAIEILEDYLRTSNNMQMKYFAANLANVLMDIYPFRYSYDEYKSRQLDNFWDISNEILNKIKNVRKKIVPYGNVDRTFYFSKNSTAVTESLKYLAFLAKTGFKIQYRWINIVNASDWYLVFTNLFESYPYPCLYYSLLLNDKNILRRIGQDFAYSEELTENLPDLLRRMLKVIHQNDTNVQLNSYYLICSEVFVAVKETEWFETFYAILCDTFLPNIDKISKLDSISSFIMAGTCRLQDQKHIKAVFVKLLEHIGDFSMYLLSEIAYDMQLDKMESLPSEIKKSLKSILQKYNVTKTYLLVAGLYRYELIDNGLKSLISKRIVNDRAEVSTTNFRVLFSLAHFTNGNSDAISIIKAAILKQDIWHCGVEGDTGTPPRYIELNKLSQDIVWTKEEIGSIMENLSKNIQILKTSKFLNDNFLGREYVPLLMNMLDFIDNKVIGGFGLNQYKHLSSEAKALLEKVTPKGSSFDILYDTERDISDSVQYLARCIDYHGANKYAESIDCMLCRALMKEPKYLNLVLGFIEFTVLKHFDCMDSSERLHKLELLLDTYTEIDYRELGINIPAMYRVMRNIAKVLSEKSNISNVSINYWLTDNKANRFSE